MTTEGADSIEHDKGSLSAKSKQAGSEPFTLLTVLSDKHRGSRSSNNSSGANKLFSAQNVSHHSTGSHGRSAPKTDSGGRCQREKLASKEDRCLRVMDKLEEMSPDRFDDAAYCPVTYSPMTAPARTRSR